MLRVHLIDSSVFVQNLVVEPQCGVRTYALVRIAVRKPISFLDERFLNGTNDEIDVEVFCVEQFAYARATSGSAVPRRITLVSGEQRI